MSNSLHNNFIKIISKNQARLSIVLSLGILILYKVFKWYLRSGVGLDPYRDYLTFETYNTCFRAFGAIVCILFCYFVYKKREALYELINKKIISFLSFYIFLFILAKILFHEYKGINLKSFHIELYFNIFTGLFEEFAFRGMLFSGLCYFLDFKKSAIISSIIFSLWHYDVYNYIYPFIALFTTSLLFSFLFHYRASLLLLSFFHFLQDQIHFGVSWKTTHLTYTPQSIYLITMNLVLIFALFYMHKNEHSKIKNT